MEEIKGQSPGLDLLGGQATFFLCLPACFSRPLSKDGWPINQQGPGLALTELENGGPICQP